MPCLRMWREGPSQLVWSEVSCSSLWPSLSVFVLSKYATEEREENKNKVSRGSKLIEKCNFLWKFSWILCFEWDMKWDWVIGEFWFISINYIIYTNQHKIFLLTLQKKIIPALKAAALAGTAAGTCEYKCMMFYEIVYKLFLLHDFYQYYFFSAYNMVACRLTDMRNGHGANISQVPLKR